MQKRDYKHIAFDIDGTLLDQNMSLRDETIRGLEEIMSRGISCSIISGRSIGDIISLFGDLEFSYFAGLNGALIYDNRSKEIEFSRTLEEPISRQLTTFINNKSLVTVYFTTHGVYISAYSDNRFARLYQESLEPHPLEEIGGYGEVLSIQVIGESAEEASTLLQELRELAGEGIEVENAGYNFLQINKKGIDKGETLKYITGKLNLSLGETVAIGDSLSDLPMLKCAGLGIGMFNGNERFLEEVDLITDRGNDRNGAVDFILNRILG